jgi:hypothetical protein
LPKPQPRPKSSSFDAYYKGINLSRQAKNEIFAQRSKVIRAKKNHFSWTNQATPGQQTSKLADLGPDPGFPATIKGAS